MQKVLKPPFLLGERAGTRTHDPMIKSHVLYRLSYALPGAHLGHRGPLSKPKPPPSTAMTRSAIETVDLAPGVRFATSSGPGRCDFRAPLALQGAVPCRSSTASPIFMPEISAWRQDIHAHPELLFDVHRTARRRGREAQELRLRRGGDRHRPHRRGRRHPRQEGRRQPHHRAARRHGCAADRGGHRPVLQVARTPARCTPAATTATPPCCSAPRNISPRRATSTAPRW